MFNKAYKKEDEEPIFSGNIYPYNLISRGYPNKVSDDKINLIIAGILEHLKSNAGNEEAVSKDTALINLGLNELNNRVSKKQSRLALIISLTSFGISLFAIFLTYAQYRVAITQIDYQLDSDALQRAIWEYEKGRDNFIDVRDVEWRKIDLKNSAKK